MAQQTKQVQATQSEPVSAYEKALVFGDVAGLSERDRLEYLKQLAASVGLDPISRPFGYLPNRETVTVYLTATGAAQLRRIHNISVTEIVDEGIVNGFYRVKVYGRMPNGRVDVEYGSVSCTYKSGDLHSPQELENDRKKVVTQAKTRLTKSMVGLSGILAEEEIESIGAEVPAPMQITAGNGHTVNTDTGEIAEDAPATPKMLEALRRKVAEYKRLADEEYDLPEPLTVKDAWAHKANLDGLLNDAKRTAEERTLLEKEGLPF